MRAVKELRWADPVLLTVLFFCLSSQLVRAGVEGLQGHWKGVLLFEGGHEADLLIGFGEASEGWPGTGLMKTPGAELRLEISGVEFKGAELSFAAKIGRLAAHFSGVIDGDKIEGGVEMEGMGQTRSGSFTLARFDGSLEFPESTQRRPDSVRSGKEGLWGVGQNEVRGASRLVYYIRTAADRWSSTPGQVAVNFGRPGWKAGYAAMFENAPSGQRWRLGSNFWTTLDVGSPIRLGGVLVDSGYYYLILESAGAGSWSLILLLPDEVRRRKLDAWHADKRPIPMEYRVPLSRGEADRTHEALQIRFVDHSELGEPIERSGEVLEARARLEVLFGPFRLSAPVEIAFIELATEGTP